ncbi:hypothetical protein [Microvirga brassicacearum]|uniref:Lipoprotein n=1 Tax=Microvirga brassicacearum TaxID=2580413 RepID=A0A5N3P3K1_9HYPH|nr:hypothetical protein [Microvirga brassicacearum]KAB0264303.1 hypothetical protein FEZ63_23670 [Microvirga brassicacearum]
MKKLALAVGLVAVGAACAPTIHETLAVECFEYIGRPISAPIAALGPPKRTFRVSPTTIGYVFEASDTRFIGNHRYYSVNYLTGVDQHRTPIRAATTTCRGNFIVRDDGLPASQRIIVDVLPAY